MAGTDRDYDTAVWTRDKWREYGIEADLEEFEVSLFSSFFFWADGLLKFLRSSFPARYTLAHLHTHTPSTTHMPSHTLPPLSPSWS